MTQNPTTLRTSATIKLQSVNYSDLEAHEQNSYYMRHRALGWFMGGSFNVGASIISYTILFWGFLFVSIV